MRRKNKALLNWMFDAKVPIMSIPRKLHYRVNCSFDLFTSYWQIAGEDDYWDTLQQLQSHIYNSKDYYLLKCPFDIIRIKGNKVDTVVTVTSKNGKLKYSRVINN